MLTYLKGLWATIFAFLFQPIVDYFDQKLIPDWRKWYTKYSALGLLLIAALPTIWDQFLASGYKELLPAKFKTLIEVVSICVLILRMIKQVPSLAALFPSLADDPVAVAALVAAAKADTPVVAVVIPSPATLNSTETEEVPVIPAKT